MADSLLFHLSGTRITNASGVIQSGAKIFFYFAGTTNPLTVYLDRNLANGQSNPVVTDSAGLVPQIYLGTNAYKYRVETSAGVLIDERDDLPGALDTSPFAASAFARPDTDVTAKTADYSVVSDDLGLVINCNPTSATFTVTLLSAIVATNGRQITVRHVGTANTVVVASSVGQTIDGKANITLHGQHESVTLVSDGANWHVKDDANVSVKGGTIAPQGYLTLLGSSTDPLNYLQNADITAASAVYYRPTEHGDLVPIYDGTRFVLYEFSEMTLTLVSQHTASAIYDVFVFLNNGVVTIGTGPAWTTATAGSGSRGTGGSTTELTRVKGLPLNANAITCRNGTSTYSVSARRATYLGSISMDGTNGQISSHVTYGQNRKWGVWNAYNQRRIALQAGDATASWSYGTNTARPSNNSSANSLAVFSGLAQSFSSTFTQMLFIQASSSTTAESTIGIGVNSTTAMSGVLGLARVQASSAGASVTRYNAPAGYLSGPVLGITNLTCLEQTTNAQTNTYHGTSSNMLLEARYLG